MEAHTRAHTRAGGGLFPPLRPPGSRMVTQSTDNENRGGRRRDALHAKVSFRDAVEQHKQFAAIRISEVLGLNQQNDSSENLDLVDGAYLEKSEWVLSKTPNAPWDIDQWANVAVGFGKILAKHLRNRIFDNRKKKDIPLSHILSESDVTSLSDDDIASVVANMSSDLSSAIQEAMLELEDGGEEDDQPRSSKFTVDNEFWLHAEDGDLAQGRQQLEDVTGPPSAELLVGMQREHCAAADSDAVFSVNSYGGVVTTPRLEWEFVAGADAVQEDGSWNEASSLEPNKTFPDDIGKRPARRGRPGGRERRHVSEFLKQELAQRAGLTAEEALALRLWTGPMHVKYNAVLSGHPKGVRLSLGSSRYSTTIALVLHALVKVSPHQELGGRRVFVGLSDQAWHSPIWKPDSLGFKGAFTRAFVSASLSLPAALTVPWTHEQRQVALEIQVARTSMAVDLAWISQYPQEQEVLFPAFSYFEVAAAFHLRRGVCLSAARPFAVITADAVDKSLQGRKETARRLTEQMLWAARRAANKADVTGDAEEAHLAALRSQAQVTAALPVRWFDDLAKFYSVVSTTVELLSAANRQAAEAAWNAGRAARALQNPEEAVRRLQTAISIAAKGCVTHSDAQAANEMRMELVGLLDEGRTGLPALHIAAIKNDLGVDLRQQGHLEAALGLCRAALDGRKRELGREHILVANAMTNVANALQGLERYEEAVEVYEEAVRVTQRLVGRDHKNVATQLNNMALLHKKMGSYDKAIQLYRESLELRVGSLGKDHPDVAATLYNLASLFAHKGDRDKSAPMFDRAALIYATALGPAHPEAKDARKKAMLCGVQPSASSAV